MPIIKRLDIKGFKSIWHDSIDLGQLNVFIGTNGAGKSNLLEAIAMLSSSLEGGIDYEKLKQRGSRLSSSAIFRSAFKSKNRTSALSVSAHLDNGVSYAMNVNAENGFKYLAESIKHESTTLAGRSNNGATVNGRSIHGRLDNKKGIFPLLQADRTLNRSSGSPEVDALAELTKYSIYAPATPLLRGTETDTSAKEPLGLYGGRLADALNEVLIDGEKTNSKVDIRRFFKLMGWVKSIGTTYESEEELLSGHITISGLKLVYSDKFMNTKFNKLYAYDVSEGALYILFILTLLSHKSAPNIFALDNVDNALNPGLIKNLMLQMAEILAVKPDKQIFLTTHNASALDGVDIFDPTHRLFVVERDPSGHTKFRRIQPPEGMTRERWEQEYYGMKLSEIWMSGAVGGLPAEF